MISVYTAVVPEEQFDFDLLGIRYAIIPYCYSVKGKTQRCTSFIRDRQTAVVVGRITVTSPHRGIGEDNIWAGIVHDDRFFGYIPGVWPGPERIEAVSIRILNTESRNLVEHNFCEKVERGDDVLEVIYHERPVLFQRVDVHIKLMIVISQVISIPKECWATINVCVVQQQTLSAAVESELKVSSTSYTAIKPDACT